MVKLNIDPLTDPEVNLVQETIDILSDPENAKIILLNILEECPELEQSFEMVATVERQASFLMNMMKRGFNYVCYQSFDTIYDIFVRHPKYGITEIHFETAYQFVIEIISQKAPKNDRNNHDNSEAVEAWTKTCNILKYIAEQAYNRPDEKQLDKNRKRVMRSMSENDIEIVQKTWKSVKENEIQVAELLANLLQTNQKIIKKFHEHNIDVFKQSLTILRMIGTTLSQLEDIDMLVPFLKKLGVKHVEMNVGPRLLASMKPMMLATLEKALGFSFTEDIKQSWNKVLAFIIGMMIEASRNVGAGGTTNKSAGDSEYADGSKITASVVSLTQKTWRHVDKVIDTAVASFYKDLLVKPEIRNLFSQSNMETQAEKLVRAIGSTIALLDSPETLLPILEELGRRHVYYNVRPKYFRYLKKAWFQMLKRALAIKWTPQVEEAWQIAWGYVTSIMKSSLEDALLLYIPPEPEKVKFKCLIHHIDRVEANTLSFYGDIWYAAYTGENPSQSAAFRADSVGDKKLEEFYDSNNNPSELAPFGGIRCLNSMDTEEIYRKLRDKWLRKYNDETWFMRGQLRGSFAQQFNLRCFPFDQHKLLLTFALDVDDGIATFDEESLFVRLMPFKMESMAGAEWDVFTPEIQIIEQSATSGGSSSGKRYTHAQVSIPITRKYSHHVVETIMPLLLIDIVSWGVYWAEEFPMVERLAVVVTLLLTLIAFKWSVAKSLPPTQYLTLMDHFFNAAYLSLFLHVVAVCAIAMTAHDAADDGNEAKRAHFYNWCFCIGNAFVFICIHSYLFYKMRYYISLYPKKTQMSALEAISRTALKSPSRKASVTSINMNVKNKKASKNKHKYQVLPINHES